LSTLIHSGHFYSASSSLVVVVAVVVADVDDVDRNICVIGRCLRESCSVIGHKTASTSEVNSLE